MTAPDAEENYLGISSASTTLPQLLYIVRTYVTQELKY